MAIGDGLKSEDILNDYHPLPSFLKAFTTSEIILIDEIEENMKKDESLEVLDALENSIEGRTLGSIDLN
jgi:hypothetical protein